MTNLINLLSLIGRRTFVSLLSICCAFAAVADTPAYAEGWYQIKRTVGLSSLADISASSLTVISSLLSDVSYLTTGDEFASSVTLPVVNISAGTSVYGAQLMDVDGVKDYTADLISQNGRNANEKYLSTYFYITPTGQDDDGEWHYTVRSINGHYMGTDGKFYATAQNVYLNSSVGVSLGESLDGVLSSLTSSLGVSVGSKQYTLSVSALENIPYIDRIDGVQQLKSLVEKLGDMGVKFSEDNWARRKMYNNSTADSTRCIASMGLLETFSSLAKDAESMIQLYNDSDYINLGRAVIRHLNVDLFKIKKVDISKVTTSTGLIAKHISVQPYTVNIIGFGDNFSIAPIDYRTADVLTRLSQKTNQNALVEYTGSQAEDETLTRVYDGGTIFVRSGTSLAANAPFELCTDNGTDVNDLSHARDLVIIDNTAHTIDIIVTSPKQTTVLGVGTGKWNDNYKTVTTDSQGLATINSPFDLTIPGDEKNVLGVVKVHAPSIYVVYSISDGKALCRQIEGTIPAGTPAIIVGDKKQSYKFTVNDSDTAEGVDNLLSGTYLETTPAASLNVYRLSADADGSPVLSAASDADRVIPAWQAYYAGASTADTIPLILNPSMSSVDSLLPSDATDASTAPIIYDLQGRRVIPSRLTPGLYIVNGTLQHLR